MKEKICNESFLNEDHNISQKIMLDCETQTESKVMKDEAGEEKPLINKKMCEEFMSESKVKYFTGFSKQRLRVLLQCLHITSTPYDVYLTVKDQLVLTLIKYKHAMDFILIGELYNLCRRIVSNIFIYWTKVIYKYLSTIDFWSLRHRGENKYTAIVDCTEITTQKSKFNPKRNKELFSHYKNNYTFKYLVAIDEKGVVTFCSSAYGGSRSDRYIFQDSKFIEKLNEGDIILADRGFDISDLLETKKVAINIPAFKTAPQFEPHQVMETRKIANRRIHVERVIGLSKKQKILKETTPTFLWPVINEIIYNANMLCNFKNSVV